MFVVVLRSVGEMNLRRRAHQQRAIKKKEDGGKPGDLMAALIWRTISINIL